MIARAWARRTATVIRPTITAIGSEPPNTPLCAIAGTMLVLAWPYPLVLLQNLVNDAFVGVTSAVGGMAVRFLRLPYDIDPTDEHETTRNR